MPEPLTSEEIKAFYGHPPSAALRNRLLAEIERLRADRGREIAESLSRIHRAETAEHRVRELEEALRKIRNELGMLGDGYPSPVANAADIARAALGEPEK